MTNDETLERQLAEVQADNRRLRHMLDRGNAPGELRHRLRNTVTMLRSIVRKSATTPRDRNEYVAQLEDRLDTLARAQSAIDDLGRVGFHKILDDELLHYGASDGGQVRLEGPEVEFEPEAAQVLSLAVHELAVNSIEHGALGSGGKVSIAWTVQRADEGLSLEMIWKDHGQELATLSTHRGFGDEVLTRMLPYALGAYRASLRA